MRTMEIRKHMKTQMRREAQVITEWKIKARLMLESHFFKDGQVLESPKINYRIHSSSLESQVDLPYEHFCAKIKTMTLQRMPRTRELD